MEIREYEKRIKALEDENAVIRERYRILEETTPALLFEYLPHEDKMTFFYNFPNDKRKREIKHYSQFVKVSPIVHPDHIQMFMEVLTKACQAPTKGEIEYLSMISGNEYQWHQTYYSSIADESGKVLSVLGRIHNVHESATKMNNMIHRVETDFLTGLYNKQSAMEKITLWLKKNRTREAHMIVIDLDNFKKINDRHGHTYGDEILKETSKILKECFDENNSIAARFGGDEFFVFVKDETVMDVQRRTDKLMLKMSDNLEFAEEQLHCSVGISGRVSREDDFEDLFNRADSAMYMAKKAGKNQCFVFKL